MVTPRLLPLEEEVVVEVALLLLLMAVLEVVEGEGERKLLQVVEEGREEKILVRMEEMEVVGRLEVNISLN